MACSGYAHRGFFVFVFKLFIIANMDSPWSLKTESYSWNKKGFSSLEEASAKGFLPSSKLCWLAKLFY